MNKNSPVTAEWARKESTSILGEKVRQQITTCESNIIIAVKKNEMSCSVNMYADKLTIAELVKRGFTCKQYDDQRDGSYLNISW